MRRRFSRNGDGTPSCRGCDAPSGAASHVATGLRAGRLQNRPSGILQIVNFEETNAALAVAFVDHGGVGTGWERRDDGRLEVVRRRELGFLDLELGAFSPVIIRGNESAIDVA